MKTSFINTPELSKSNSRKRYGETTLPPMASCPQYDPNDARRAESTSYVMKTDEETQRFLEYNYAKKMLLAQVIPAGASVNQIKEVMDGIILWRGRADHLREYIVRVNMPLIYSQVARNRQRYSSLDWDTAVSIAHSPLMSAVEKFDVTRGFKFSTYACRAILNSLSRADSLARQRANRMHTVQLADYQGECVDEDKSDPLADAKVRLNQVISTNRANLNSQELLVITARFGLADGECRTLESAGVSLGVTKERVRQIQIKALKKLRVVMGDLIAA